MAFKEGTEPRTEEPEIEQEQDEPVVEKKEQDYMDLLEDETLNAKLSETKERLAAKMEEIGQFTQEFPQREAIEGKIAEAKEFLSQEKETYEQEGVAGEGGEKKLLSDALAFEELEGCKRIQGLIDQLQHMQQDMLKIEEAREKIHMTGEDVTGKVEGRGPLNIMTKDGKAFMENGDGDPYQEIEPEKKEEGDKKEEPADEKKQEEKETIEEKLEKKKEEEKRQTVGEAIAGVKEFADLRKKNADMVLELTTCLTARDKRPEDLTEADKAILARHENKTREELQAELERAQRRLNVAVGTPGVITAARGIEGILMENGAEGTIGKEGMEQLLMAAMAAERFTYVALNKNAEQAKRELNEPQQKALNKLSHPRETVESMTRGRFVRMMQEHNLQDKALRTELFKIIGREDLSAEINDSYARGGVRAHKYNFGSNQYEFYVQWYDRDRNEKGMSFLVDLGEDEPAGKLAGLTWDHKRDRPISVSVREGISYPGKGSFWEAEMAQRRTGQDTGQGEGRQQERQEEPQPTREANFEEIEQLKARYPRVAEVMFFGQEEKDIYDITSDKERTRRIFGTLASEKDDAKKYLEMLSSRLNRRYNDATKSNDAEERKYDDARTKVKAALDELAGVQLETPEDNPAPRTEGGEGTTGSSASENEEPEPEADPDSNETSQSPDAAEMKKKYPLAFDLFAAVEKSKLLADAQSLVHQMVFGDMRSQAEKAKAALEEGDSVPAQKLIDDVLTSGAAWFVGQPEKLDVVKGELNRIKDQLATGKTDDRGLSPELMMMLKGEYKKDGEEQEEKEVLEVEPTSDNIEDGAAGEAYYISSQHHGEQAVTYGCSLTRAQLARLDSLRKAGLQGDAGEAIKRLLNGIGEEDKKTVDAMSFSGIEKVVSDDGQTVEIKYWETDKKQPHNLALDFSQVDENSGRSQQVVMVKIDNPEE